MEVCARKNSVGLVQMDLEARTEDQGGDGGLRRP